jgi:hypothetical protein
METPYGTRQTEPARSVSEAWRTLTPAPLVTREELDAFRCKTINIVRKSNAVREMARGLRRARGGAFYRAAFYGHRGVGKTTELSQLKLELADEFEVVTFDVTDELNPARFQPFDVPLLIMMLVVERIAGKTKGGLGLTFPDTHLRDVRKWFEERERVRKTEYGGGVEAEAGVGIEKDGLLSSLFGVFASTKGQMRYGVGTTDEVRSYEMSRITQLVDLCNRLLVAASETLSEEIGKELLVVGEGFDRGGISKDRVRELFVDHGNVLSGLHTNLILTVPPALVYSADRASLPFARANVILLPDTPIYRMDESRERLVADEAGRKALRKAITRRIEPELLENGVLDLIVAKSGGNLRDLISLALEAADKAELRGAETVSLEDAQSAVYGLLDSYRERLGSSEYDTESITTEEKLDCLVRIHRREPIARISDHVHHHLLRARVVQEFQNSTRWFGVHPVVVDLLKQMDYLREDE